MTAEGRAREIVSRRLSDLANGDWEPVIVEAVRAAIAAEREACAAACDAEVTRLRDRWSEVYDGCRGFPDHQQGAFMDGLSAQQSVCESLARALRARGTP